MTKTAAQNALTAAENALKASDEIYATLSEKTTTLDQLTARQQTLARMIPTQENKVASYDVKINAQQAIITEAEATIRENRTTATNTQTTILALNAVIERGTTTQANYTRDDSERGYYTANSQEATDGYNTKRSSSTWLTTAKDALAEAKNLKATEDAKSDENKDLKDYSAAMAKVDAALAALEAGQNGNAYSEVSLETAIQLTQELKTLADEMRAATEANTTTVRYQEYADADQNYKLKLVEQQHAQITYDDAVKEKEEAAKAAQKAAAALTAANAKVTSAQTAEQAAAEAVTAAQDELTAAMNDQARAQAQAKLDKANANWKTANKTLTVAQKAATEAQTEEAAADAALRTAEGEVNTTLAALNTAKGVSETAKAAVEAAEAGITKAEATMRNARNTSVAVGEMGYELSNTKLDVEARDLHVMIGQANEGGEINIHNEGHITLTVDSGMQIPQAVATLATVALHDSDVTIGNIVSDRGDVSVTNKSGSILAGENEDKKDENGNEVLDWYTEENIHGRNIVLDARDSIGDATKAFVVEETALKDKVIYNAYVVNKDNGTVYGGRVTEDGNGIASRRGTNDPIGNLYANGTQVDPVLSLTNDEGAEGNEGAGTPVIVALRKDIIREHDKTEGTTLNAKAGTGSIYLVERTGDIRSDYFEAGIGQDGNLVLTTDSGDITATVIRTGGDTVLNAVNGVLPGTPHVAVGGEMTVNTNDDVRLISEGNLTLNLNTDVNHVEITTDDATSTGDITVISHSDLALTGSALSNGSVKLVNGGDIGTTVNPFEIDTDENNNGTVTINGKNLYINNAEGGIIVNEITADGDLDLAATGDILDAGNAGLGDTLDKVTQAQMELTEAERNLTDLLHALDDELHTPELAAAIAQDAAAKQAAEQAKTALTNAQNAQTAAQNAYNEAENAYNQIKDSAEATDEQKAAAKAAMDKAEADLLKANQAVTDATAAKDAADQAAQKAADALAAEQAKVTAANAEVQAATDVRDRAKEKLQIAEDLLDVQQEYRDQRDVSAEAVATLTAEEEAKKAAEEATAALADATEKATNAYNGATQTAKNAYDTYQTKVGEQKTAQQTVDQKQQAKDEAQAAYDEAKLAADDAMQAADAAKTAADDAQDAYDAAKADYENAQTEAAWKKLIEARVARDEAKAEQTAAETALSTANGDLATKQSALNTAEGELTTAKNNLDTANTNLQNAETALGNADQNLLNATKAQEAAAQAKVEADENAKTPSEKAQEALTAATVGENATDEEKAAMAAAQEAKDIIDAERIEAEALKDRLIATEQLVGAEENLHKVFEEYQNLANNQANDPTITQADVHAAKAKVDAAEKGVKEAQQALALIDAATEAKAERDAAQAEVDAARADEQKLQEAADAVTQAQNDLDSADTAVNDKKDAVDEKQRAYDEAKEALKNATTDAEKATALANLETKEAALKAAQNELTEAQNEQKEAQKALTEAKQDQAKAETETGKKLDQATADREAAETALNGAQDALEKADNDKQLVENMQERLEKAAEAEKNLANLPANATDEERANAQTDVKLAAEALAAAKDAIEKQVAVNNATEKRDEAQAALDEATAIEKELADATDAVARAQTGLDGANTALTEAHDDVTEAQGALSEAIRSGNEEAIAAAEATLQTAKDNLAEAQKEQNEAQAALTEAEKAQAKVEAETGKTLEEAQTDRTTATTNRDNAQTALDNANTALANATNLADATATAADKQSEKEAADKAKADAIAYKGTVDQLLADLAEAEAAETAAQNLRNTAYDGYLMSNTGMKTASNDNEKDGNGQTNNGTRDVNTKKGTLDNETNDLNDKKSTVEELKEQLKALTGTDDPTAAAAAAEANVDAAETAANTAATNANNADSAVNVAITTGSTATDAEALRNDLRNGDTTGTDSVRPEGAKEGDAAIRVTGNSNLTSREGSVGGQPDGNQNNALTMDTDGVTTINAAQDVNLGTSQDLNINQIKAGDDVNLTGHGNMTGVGGDPTISGDALTMDAISTGNDVSTIGNAGGGAMTTDVNELGLRGDEAGISNSGSVTLNDIVSENTNITASGDVNQNEGTEIDSGSLNIQDGGNIGSNGNPIVTNVDEITANAGGDVNLENKSDDLTVNDITGNNVNINTAGNINTTPDGMITAHNLTITAVYDIGTPENPLRVTVDGILNIKSLRGREFYVNFYKPPVVTPETPVIPIRVIPTITPEEPVVIEGGRLLVDKVTGIKVYGKFSPTAWLSVLSTAHYAMTMDPVLQELVPCGEDLTVYSANCTAAAKPEVWQSLIDHTESDVCKMLWALARDGKSLYDFMLGIFANDSYVCEGTMHFEVSLSGLDETYDGHLEGETLYVMLCVADELVCVPAQVQDGVIRFKLERLGMNNADYGYTPFVIVDGDVFTSLLEGNTL